MAYTIGDPLLTLKDISLKYGDNLILRDVNIDIKNIVSTSSQILGQVTTVVGKSGVGKSQLFKIIAGLVIPSTGEVLVGKDQHPVQPGRVGMVLQTYPLFEHRTLLSNMLLVTKDMEKIDFYLNEFDIIEHKNKYPKKLSGGQRQRAAIVQQMLCSEDFILLDEPFSGLDPVATDKLCKNITKVANLSEDTTVIISSHILEPSLAISDDIWIIGHEYTESEGKRDKIPGATILHKEDLAAQGLAWDPEIRRNPRFIDLVENLRTTFHQI